jgi:hypothetical protein
VNVENLVRALEVSLQAEVRAKQAQTALLEREERAIAARDPAELEAAARDLHAGLQREAERAAERARLLSALGASLGLPGVPRVSAVAERLGARGAGLSALRTELRARCAETLLRGRRVGVLVRAHAALVEEALGRFLSPDPSGAPLGRGALVDARA